MHMEKSSEEASQNIVKELEMVFSSLSFSLSNAFFVRTKHPTSTSPNDSLAAVLSHHR